MKFKKVSKKAVSVSQQSIQKTTPKYTDLRQVMDYKKPLSIFFSGVEYESYLDILYDLGVRDFLMSYEYLKGKGHAQLSKYSDIRLFIDSGGYTYNTNPEYESYTTEQWEKQIQDYLLWAKKHKDSIFAIADLDVQYLVGNEQVYEWRKKYFEPFMLETGIPVCFIYHEEGDEQWEYMCKRYPYIGISLNVDGNIDDNDLRNKFRVAEKYNTLIQGMASTRTSMLTDFPFYTVDSTTWNVGLKYGEISVWNGSRMHRIKKVDFETKAFPQIQAYDYHFDIDLLRQEDKTEMIKVNAYAFVAAEKYINDRLKSRMYWFKAKAIKRDVNSLPTDIFPPASFFGEENPALEDLKKYAESLNINAELSPEELRGLIFDTTAFCNWDNSEYSSLQETYSPELISGLHDMWVNRICQDDEKVSDLTQFFKECVAGDNDKLLQYGTNFDRTVKERDNYLEDEDEREEVDLSPEEVQVKLAHIIPTTDDEENAPELDKLDKEIYAKAEIVPVFDSHGKFIKGQTAIRKPKKVYSKKYPKLACDTCFAAAKCPEYKAGFVCAYDKLFHRFDTRNMADIIQSMQGIVEQNMVRMQKSMVMETINGVIDPVTSQLMDTNIKYMQMLKQMYECGSSEVLRQTHVIRSDGTEEKTTSITNPQSGGILEKLFSGMTSDTKEPIEEEKPADKNERYNIDPDDIIKGE